MHNKIYDWNDPLCIQEAFAKAKLRQLNESKLTKNFKRFILFDKKDYEKINKFKFPGLKIEYVYSDTFIFNITNNQFIIKNSDDAKNETIINFDESESTIIYCKSGYLNPDAVYLLNKFIELDFLVLNNPMSVQINSNRLLTAKLFDEHNIQQPKYAIVTADDCNIDADEDKFKDILRTIYEEENEDNEYICKILNGHGEHGVFKCRESNILSVIQCVFAVDSKMFKILIQEKMDIEDGVIRAYVLNLNGKQEIIDCLIRQKSNDDSRVNVSKFKLKDEYKTLVQRAAKDSELAISSIDLCIIKETKQAYIIEINGDPAIPVSIDANDEETKEAHEKFYTNVINKIIDLSDE